MSSKSKQNMPYKELIKNCKNLQSANIVLAALLLRRLKKKKAEKSKRKSEILCCRTCLGTEQLEPIFGTDTDENKSNDLYQITGLDIQKDDGLPQSMCTACTKFIKDNITFRNECKKAESKLYTWGLQNLKSDSKFNTIKEIIQSEVIKEEPEEYIDDCDMQMYGDGEYRHDRSDDEYIDQDLEMAQQAKASLKKKCNKIKKPKLSLPPYKCHICKKLLANTSSLRSHLNWHTGQTAYICETCGKRCMNRTAFLQHMKGKHGLQRTDKCTYCDYMALNKEQLKIHERRHTGERPYICDHCGSGFHRRANLVQHLPIHLPVKTVQCDLCPSTFKSSKFLATHKSRAHSNKHYSYVCHICNSVYKKSFNVRKHLLKVHAVPRDQQGNILRVRVRCFGDSVYNTDT